MAILGKTPLAISPAASLSVLSAKRPPSMTQTPADPAAADTREEGEPEAAAQALPPVAAPTRTLHKAASTDSVLEEDKSVDGGDTPGSTTSSNAPQRQRKYERKTKRFIWPDELHRLFVAAIFDVGLKNASPKALLALMGSAGPGAGLTTEHLKSHLQKYRLNYERSRQEFLDFYDQSAKKNLKRRRKQASRAGEHNSMFVFPIVNKKDGRDSDDDSDEDADVSMSMSDSTQSEQPTPRDKNDKDRSFSELLPRAERAKSIRGRNTLQQQQQLQPGDDLGNASPNERSHFAGSSTHAVAAQALQSFGNVPVSAGIPKQNLAGGQIDSRAMSGLPLRYSGSVAGMAVNAGPGGINMMTDPQWNILNSMMMSPQLAGMVGNVPPHQLPFATSEAMANAGAPSDTFALANEEAPDLQLQMHLAMQAHMNLHRQMLTRKVEVSQHATAAQIAAANSAAFGAQRHHQQQQQQWMSEQAQLQHQRQQIAYQQSTPVSLAQDQAQGRRSFSMQQSVPENQPMSILPRPSLSSAPVVQPTTTSESRSQPTTTAPASVSSVIDAVMAEDVAAPPSANLDSRNDDDSLDLYRWDRIDLNVDLEDDDLFGFLKS